MNAQKESVLSMAMDELNKGLNISVHGTIADEALRSFRKQAADWQIALPSVRPLVLDFGLGQFNQIGLIEFWIANEAAAGYCGKYLFVFDGQAALDTTIGQSTRRFFSYEADSK